MASMASVLSGPRETEGEDEEEAPAKTRTSKHGTINDYQRWIKMGKIWQNGRVQAGSFPTVSFAKIASCGSLTCTDLEETGW